MKTYTTKKTGRACYAILNAAGGLLPLGSAFKEPGSAGYLGIVETETKTYMTGGMTIAEAAAAVAQLHATVHRPAAPLPLGVTCEVTARWHGRHATAYSIRWAGIEIGTVAESRQGGGLWIAEAPATSPEPPEVLYHQRAAGRDAEHAARVFCEGWIARQPPVEVEPPSSAYAQARLF